MSIIVDLGDYADRFTLRLSQFKSKCRVKMDKLNEKDVKDLIHVLIDTHINDRLLWANSSHAAKNKKIKELFPWWSPDSDNILDIDFYDMVIQETLCDLIPVLELVVTDRTWLIIDVKRIGDSCFIVKGEDYRIVDWHRIQDAKKLKEKKRETLLVGC